MWERTTVDHDYDDEGNIVATRTTIEGGPSWYDYILEMPSAIRYWWCTLGFYTLLIPIVIPYILIRDAFTRRKDDNSDPDFDCKR